MTGLVGGPLLVGGLGPGPPGPLKSGPEKTWLDCVEEEYINSLSL